MRRIDWLIVFGCVVVFIWLRWWHLDVTNNLFGDAGRDFWTLQRWQQTGIPPLLGPQNSAISFNQSAVYFYLLFPFYLLSGHSVLSPMMAVTAIYLGVLALGLYVWRRQAAWRSAVLAGFFLIAIHPQLVSQQRYIWNPSFITAFLLPAVVAVLWLKVKPQRWLLVVISFGLAMAVSLNYSLVPTAVTLFLLACWQLPSWRQRLELLGWQILAGLVVNAPTLAFEVRHDWFLTRGLLHQEVLQLDVVRQHRWLTLLMHVLVPFQPQWATLAGITTAGLLIGGWWQTTRGQVEPVVARSYRWLVALVVVNAALLVALPLTIHEHYIFGVLSLLVLAVALMPQPWRTMALVAAVVAWSQPIYAQRYLRLPPLATTIKQACLAQVCSELTQPVFVNTHSSSHNHQAWEYAYLLKENGCQALTTNEFQPGMTQQMVVVAEHATFSNGQTGYYELSQFGPATEVKRWDCHPDLQVHLLTK